METFAWRYKPEFIISTLVSNQQAGEYMELFPSPATARLLKDYGFIVRGEGGRLAAFARQIRQGSDWVPAYAMAGPLSFTFWLKVKQGSEFQISSVFTGSAEFGRLIFYANNLSPAGEIDAGMTGNALELIPSPAQVEEKKGGLSSSTFSVRFPAGSYNEVRAGKIRPGAAVAFQLTKAIQDTQTGAELDFRLLPKGAYIVQLQGSPAKEGRVVFDEAAMAAGIGGIVDIHKDAWRSPSGPNEYRINFIST